MKYIFFLAIILNNVFYAMVDELNTLVQDNDKTNQKIIISPESIEHFIKHDLLDSDEIPSRDDDSHYDSFARAFELLKLKHPEKYKQFEQEYEQLAKKYQNSNIPNKGKREKLSEAEINILKICINMLEEQNKEDFKQLTWEKKKGYISWGLSILGFLATSAISIYTIVRPALIVCNGTAHY